MPNPTPRTIAELQAWYAAHNLPPEEVTRFFIGKDVHEAKAFGIYQDGDRFVVYKNKADGSRAVRYDGPDEGYAVNELYLKLKQEIANQKAGNFGKKEADPAQKRRQTLIVIAVVAVMIIGIALTFILDRNTPNRGYYYYDDTWYYYQMGSWYYDYGDEWYPCNAEPAVAQHYSDSYQGSDYRSGASYPDFETTQYYSNTDTDSSWSSSDSWDSGSTDWSSDW